MSSAFLPVEVPVCWAAVYPVAHLTTPAITAENAMAMDQNKNGFMNRGKMKCLPILTLKNGLAFLQQSFGFH